MLIDYREVSQEALVGIAQQYVQTHLSDTDPELALESWTQLVIEKVKRGELVIEYSEANDSVFLKSVEDLAKIVE